jgi:hypothetical protein
MCTSSDGIVASSVMSEDKSERELARWRKKIGMIGIDIKGLHQETEAGRLKLKTKLMNERFINELDRNRLAGHIHYRNVYWQL